MIKCTCEGTPRIGYAEALMAEALGKDVMEIHAWSDTFEEFLDMALDPEMQEGRIAHWKAQGFDI